MKDSLLRNYVKAFSLMNRVSKLIIPSAILSSFFTAVIPYISLFFSARIIDGLLSKTSYDILYNDVLLLIGITLGCGILGAAFTKLRTFLADKAHYLLGLDIARKSLYLDFENFEDPNTQQMRKKAEAGSNFNGGISGMIESISTGIIRGLFTIIFSIGGISSLILAKTPQESELATFTNSVWFLVTLIVLIVIPIIVGMSFTVKSAKVQQTIFDEIVFINRTGDYFDRELSDYENGKLFRMYQMQDFLINITKGYVAKSLDLMRRVYKAIYTYVGTSQIVSILATAFLYCLVISKAYVGAITIGSILMYVGYLQKMLDSLTNSVNQLVSANIVVDYLKHYYDFLAIKSSDTGDKMAISDDFEIVFENVSFKYPNSDNYSLRNINCTIRKNEKLAIVGQNGTGKTTFIKLLCNLYKPTKGRILLNGVDINTIDKQNYADLISVVFQDFNLFATSLAQNVAADTSVDYDRLYTSLEIVGISERVAKMDNKEETMLTRYLDDSGVELSGGEAQKIAIARAWYKDSPLIILDEPTAALDPLSEFEIYNNFNDIVKDKSAIYISHRMSSCRFCERIIVFDDGTIVQQGNHDSLMKDKKGIYFQLFNAQAQYYIDENTEMMLT